MREILPMKITSQDDDEIMLAFPDSFEAAYNRLTEIVIDIIIDVAGITQPKSEWVNYGLYPEKWRVKSSRFGRWD